MNDGVWDEQERDMEAHQWGQNLACLTGKPKQME